MASIQTASVNTLAYLQRKNKITYVSLVVLLSIFLLLDYIPGYSTWVTPPVALFLGLIFALSSLIRKCPNIFCSIQWWDWDSV